MCRCVLVVYVYVGLCCVCCCVCVYCKCVCARVRVYVLSVCVCVCLRFVQVCQAFNLVLSYKKTFAFSYYKLIMDEILYTCSVQTCAVFIHHYYTCKTLSYLNAYVASKAISFVYVHGCQCMFCIF